MKTSEFQTIQSDELKQFMNTRKENEYILIDVRQPVEYETAHIPGSLLRPLNQLMQSFSGLPEDKDIIFYCHVGSRSQVAAMMAAEEEFSRGSIYSLDGGIQAWNGKTLKEIPRVGIFTQEQTLTGFLETAMNMEKGAQRFYRLACEKFSSDSISALLGQLAEVETAHAKMLYTVYLEHTASDPAPFESFYDGLAGDFIEGGVPLDTCVDHLVGLGEQACTALLEYALDIEFAAYDLYRTMANQNSGTTEVADVFLSIAQAEKSHMNMISAAFEKC